jgi:hypothetical protein
LQIVWPLARLVFWFVLLSLFPLPYRYPFPVILEPGLFPAGYPAGDRDDRPGIGL